MKNHGKQSSRLRGDSGQRRRTLAVMLVLGIAVFLPVGLRLYSLMVVQYERYRGLALGNQTRSTAVTADRGTIYDRNMNILACSRHVETVYLDPHELRQAQENPEDISSFLAEVLDVDRQKILRKAKDTSYRYQQIADRVEEETAGKIRAYINEHDIRGIHLEPGSRRYYPYGPLAAQVIGFTNRSNTGSEGVEAAYDAYLSGRAGKVVTTKGNNELDMPFSYEQFVRAGTGCSLVLTLDATVQACLEKQMEAAIARYQVHNGAFGLVMNVNTGEILAMATLGSYDPNNYLEVTDQTRLADLNVPEDSPEYRKALTEARLKQWRNRCISDGYEPGSTFKVMTMAAALDTGAIDLNTRFYCRGAEQIPGRSQLLHCWRSAGHGSENTAQALQNSCNLAFAHIGLKLGGEQFYEYIQRFGATRKTGIDLYGESGGVFFSKELITDTRKWGTASLTSASFGQTFKLTPLQLVRGIASVVNGGKLLQPYLVSEVVDEAGKTVLRQEPTLVGRTVKPETSSVMCSLIRSVVTEGTAKNANVYGYSVGGKTGTSEKIDVFDENGRRVPDKIVSFVGIAPMDKPEYIVLVGLDTPSRAAGYYISGGVMAAPTVGAVMADILPYLGVRQSFDPEDPAGSRKQVPDLSGLDAAEAKKQAEAAGLCAVFRGQGTAVTGQIPHAGREVSGGSQVLIYLDQEPGLVEIPDFMGMNRSQAAQAAGRLTLPLRIRGNDGVDPQIVVTEQLPKAGELVPEGTPVTLKFTDIRAAD